MVKLKYVQPVKSRGRVYYYFRRGDQSVRLPDNPETQEFSVAYWRARLGTGRKNVKTTFSNLIEDYYRSSKFQELAPNTQKEYRYIMEAIREKNGPRDFTQLRRKDVIAAREAHAKTWRKANKMVQMLSILSRHAIDLEWITQNPAADVTKMKGGSWEPWPEGLLEAFETYCDTHDTPIERLAYELAVGTGQRIGDILKMRWEQFDDEGYVSLVQEKTGTFVQVYCPERLQNYLAPLRQKKGVIFAGRSRESLSKRALEGRIHAIRKQIGAEKYVIHGWRYNAAKELAEAGASDAEIQSVTGHRTAQMVQKYRGQAQRKELSKGAQQRRGKTKSVKQSVKPAETSEDESSDEK